MDRATIKAVAEIARKFAEDGESVCFTSESLGAFFWRLEEQARTTANADALIRRWRRNSTKLRRTLVETARETNSTLARRPRSTLLVSEDVTAGSFLKVYPDNAPR
jgi:hypothetical protein